MAIFGHPPTLVDSGGHLLTPPPFPRGQEANPPTPNRKSLKTVGGFFAFLMNIIHMFLFRKHVEFFKKTYRVFIAFFTVLLQFHH